MKTSDLEKSNTKKIIWICVSVLLVVGIVAAIVFGMQFQKENQLTNAFAKLSNGEYDSAIAEFDKLIVENNKDISAYAGKAMAQISAGDETGASDTIDEMAYNCDDPEKWVGTPSQSTTSNSGNSNTGGSEVTGTGNDGVEENGLEGDGNFGSQVGENPKVPNMTVGDLPVIDDPKNPPIDQILRYTFRWKFIYNVNIGKADENEKVFNLIEESGLNAYYNIYTRPEMPTTDCPGGKYDKPIMVNLYCTAGNTIRYRTETGELNLGNSVLYEQPIYITKNHSVTNLIAATYDRLYIPSEPLNLTYELERGALTAPEYSHNSGEYSAAFKLTLSNPNNEGKIFYTTDGSEPTAESKEYSGGISIGEGNTNIKAKIIDSENGVSSETVSLTYNVTLPKPTVSPKSEDTQNRTATASAVIEKLLSGEWTNFYLGSALGYNQYGGSYSLSFRSDGTYIQRRLTNPIQQESGTYSVTEDGLVNLSGIESPLRYVTTNKVGRFNLGGRYFDNDYSVYIHCVHCGGYVLHNYDLYFTCENGHDFVFEDSPYYSYLMFSETDGKWYNREGRASESKRKP